MRSCDDKAVPRGYQRRCDDYPGPAPWAFTGGTIRRAAVDVSGEPFVDLAAEARMAFMRD
jgi:arylsulfatase